ncbi:MAG: cell division protein SepF [Candidatus Bathyarchaeia archaeon]
MVDLARSSSKTKDPQVYVKAIPLIDRSDVEKIKAEAEEGHILIVKITPLAKKSVEDTKEAISQLKEYVAMLGGDIARLGEERILITPPSVKIWRGG